MLFIAPGLFNLEFDGMADNFVEISGLYFARNKRQIFKDVNLNVPRGKITAIMGPSGSGKTTLLRLISAQLHPQQGKVCVNGIDIHQLNRFDLYQTRGLMGMLFQSGALFTSLDVFENVAFPLREHTNLPEEIIRDVVLMQLEVVGLRGARRLMPSELSGGMSHRVALARSLVLNPKLMMYDEPFTGQDPITMGVLVRLIKQLNSILGLTSIIVSHDVAEILSIADYVYVVASGSVIGEGTAAQIVEDRSPLVNQFVHGVPDGPIPFHYPAKNYQEDLSL